MESVIKIKMEDIKFSKRERTTTGKTNTRKEPYHNKKRKASRKDH